MSPPGSPPAKAPTKFPDFVPPTKIHYAGDGFATLHIRQCVISYEDASGQAVERTFDQGEVRIGAMDDNEVVLNDATVSRYHCKIVQESSGYVLVDLGSTNGTFINNVRVREAYLAPNCTVRLGQAEANFYAGEREVEIVPSREDRCVDIIGCHPKLREIYAIIEKIAPSNATVVIEGETGTGKEVVAQTIHKLSARSARDIVVFDCGAVPANLVESELFGHEKGSFTGAVMTRRGLFEAADGGTLFLDEIGELPLDLQPKLLRVLERREIRRVGANKSIQVDVRIVAATNRNLEEEVRAGRFREDLFYRLSVVGLTIPPLRDRTEDVPLLVSHFLETHDFNKEKKVSRLSHTALQALQTYGWPGNVRELLNTVERALSFCDGDVIELSDLPEHFRAALPLVDAARAEMDLSVAQGVGDPADQRTFKESKERWVASFERDYIVKLLRKSEGNISHAAREAEIDRKYFRKLMKKYEIETDDL